MSPLNLSGSTGISGVDGSAGTPAIQGTDTNTGISFPAADTVAINTGGSERVRTDSSGRVLVGTSTGYNDARLQVVGNTGGDPGRIDIRRNADNPVANSEIGTIRFSDLNGASGQYATIQCFADAASTSSGDLPGRLVFSTTADGASSPTERMRIDNKGNVYIGNTEEFPTGNNVAGITLANAGTGLWIGRFSSTGSECLDLNRKTNDGTIVKIRQDGTEEGSISVSGTTVSYNGAHLSRWSQIPGIDPHDKTDRPEILRGTVMSNLDEMCDWIDPESGEAQDNEQLNKTKISDVDDDPNVAGVFQAWDDDDDTWVNDYYLAMTGDFVIRIAEDVVVQRGDLLVSAGDGTARPQGDRYIKDSTIAKVTSTTVSCTHPDGSYCVPCVLMAC